MKSLKISFVLKENGQAEITFEGSKLDLKNAMLQMIKRMAEVLEMDTSDLLAEFFVVNDVAGMMMDMLKSSPEKIKSVSEMPEELKEALKKMSILDCDGDCKSCDDQSKRQDETEKARLQRMMTELFGKGGQ